MQHSESFVKQHSNKLFSSLALMFLLPINSQANTDSSTSSSELTVDDETVKLALKINRKVLEEEIVEVEHLDKSIDVLNIKDNHTYLDYYFQEYLPVTKNEGEPVNLSIKSADLVGETVVFNFEAPLEDANMLSINNRVLFDSHDEQVNKVLVADNSYTFTNSVDEPLIVWQKGHSDSLI